MTVKAGDYADADMIQTYPRSLEKTIIFQIPIRGLPTTGGIGHYHIDTIIWGSYAGKRFEIPVSYKFNYIGGKEFLDIKFVNLEDLKSQIVSASIEYDNKVIYELKR